MVAPVSFSRWFGSLLRMHQSSAERSLALSKAREECRDVKVAFSG